MSIPPMAPLLNGDVSSLPDRSVIPQVSIHQKEKDLPGGKRWVVQKFGGTSVGKFARQIASDIVSVSIKYNRISVVCSARSTHTKNEGTTNRLLRSAREAEKPGSREYIPIIEAIRLDHIRAAQDNIATHSIVESLTADINNECDSLIKILESAQHLEEVSARAEDKIIAKGEKLSCRFMTALLQDLGVNAVYIDLADILKPLIGNATSDPPRLDEDFYQSVARALGQRVFAAEKQSQEPIVPVVTGYFGPVPGGLLTSIGRGYTDLCAALLAVGLDASELQIWKEVDGIFTADPRKVPTARLLDSVTPSEAAELTFYGSEVIHPFTMEQVIRARIPIRIKNVMNPRGNGTVIFPDPITPDAQDTATANGRPNQLFRTRTVSLLASAPTRSTSSSGPGLPSIEELDGKRPQKPGRPTAVTVKHNIVILNVHSNKRTRAHGFLMRIFNILDRHHLSVDLISSSEVHVSMALHSSDPLMVEPSDRPQSPGATAPGTPTREKAGDAADAAAALSIANASLHAAVSELAEFGTVDIVPHCAIVSLVGKQLRNMTGISGRFLSTLGRAGINIEMISQGASEINISCVIEEREADHALSVVHASLFTFLEDDY